MILVAGVAALLQAPCSPPAVNLGGAGARGATEPVANADAAPPAAAADLKGPITSVTKTKPVTTDCVSEADPDPDAAVSDDDPPVCNPEPDSSGSVGVSGNRAD